MKFAILLALTTTVAVNAHVKDSNWYGLLPVDTVMTTKTESNLLPNTIETTLYGDYDSDGISNDTDRCDHTPAGQPVWAADDLTAKPEEIGCATNGEDKAVRVDAAHCHISHDSNPKDRVLRKSMALKLTSVQTVKDESGYSANFSEFKLLTPKDAEVIVRCNHAGYTTVGNLRSHFDITLPTPTEIE